MNRFPNIPIMFSPDCPGKAIDMKFLLEDRWLMDTEVRYLLQAKKSRWHLTMVYIAINNPMRFLCRKIEEYPSEAKAKTYAQILQRGIRKDARGTLKTDEDAFNLCSN